MSKITVQKCKADCEFYGNPQWGGYCSKCFQEHCSRETSNSLSSNLLGFFRGTSSPLSKKRHEEEKLEAPSPHKPRSTSNASTASRESSEAAPENTQTNLFSYFFMLRTGKYADPAISDQTRAFIYRIRGSKENCIHKADEVQQFYKVMGTKLRNHTLFQGWEQEKLDNLIISMERFIMVNICAVVFNPAEDEERNIMLQEQVKSLHWLLPKHLDFSLPSDNENTDRYLAVAQQNLLEMSKKRSPLDKLQCMVATCKAIYELLKVANDNKEAGADEFLPVLIYVLICAAPPNLHSTIQYIDRFLPQERLMSGEMAYHFTNICCAAEFLENVRPDQLSVSKDEFERYMGGHSSHLEDALSARVTAGLTSNIDRLKESEEKLRQLQNNQMKLRMNAEQLQEDLRKHHAATLAKIRTYVDEYQKIGIEIDSISSEGQV